MGCARCYDTICQQTTKIPDARLMRPKTIPIADAAMFAAAMFALKFPSMLQFVDAVQEPGIGHNLKNLFHVNQAPSDTTMREILDPVPTSHFQNLFKSLFAKAQRGKVLEGFRFMNGYLVSLDGTGFFSSHEVHCQNCYVKNHRDGTQTFYHQILAGVLIHPDRKEVIPLAP